MPISYQHDEVPDLWAFELPKAEREHAAQLQSQLQEMATITDEAASAVALFDHARQRMRFLEELLGTNPMDRISSPQKREKDLISRWQFMAARAFLGAVRRLDAVRLASTSLADTLPTIAPLVDRKALKQANSMFRGDFHRHADPSGEIVDGRANGLGAARSLHRGVPAAAANPALPDAHLAGSAVTYSYEGRLEQLEISQRVLARLLQVRNQYFAAFAQVGPTLQERGSHASAQEQRQCFDD